MDVVTCPHCEARLWPEERVKSPLANPVFEMCCCKGKVSLPKLPRCPAEQEAYWLGETPGANHFRRNARAYNSSLAFTSQGAKIDLPFLGGVQVLRINGAPSHRLSPLIPTDGYQPSFAQLHIMDSDYALQRRQEIFPPGRNNVPVLRPGILKVFQNSMLERNPYAQRFHQAGRARADQYAAQIEAAAEQGVPLPDDVPNVVLELMAPVGPDKNDPRRYNLPTDQNEIAAFIPESVLAGPDTGVATRRDIQVKLINGKLSLPNTSPHLDPLRYPLLFPTGAPGWGLQMPLRPPPDIPLDQHEAYWRSKKRQDITLQQYTAYRIMPRREDPAQFFRGGRLFQEYLVDSYARIESSRLEYVKQQQKALRADTYRGLADAVEAGDHDRGRIGLKVILPSSFTGGPRYMQQACADAIAVCTKYGKPDAFITMTCNPYWPEILAELLPNQSPSDRPDLCARVFNMKKKALMEDLRAGEVLGKVVAYLFVIEFQKRGLPHAHILIHFAPEDKLRTPADIDSIISAQLPDPETQTRLYAAVTKHMLHGPCGPGYNMGSPCMHKTTKVCTKNFPKPSQPETVAGDDSYPTYARPDNGRTVTRPHPNGAPGDTIQLTNQWVVPHNPALLLKYNCHINVEICCSIRSIKYMHKYVYKGHDRAEGRFVGGGGADAENEIKQYLKGRYISASEAVYRILEMPMHCMYPAVDRLAVHLPGDQFVTFEEGRATEAVAEGPKDTKLTAFFKLMLHNPEHRTLKYPDVVDHFTWEAQPRRWKLRTNRSNTMARMYSVHPAAGDRFFLRLLLLTVPGPTSFEDLRTHDGILYPTFRDACVARGLTEDSQEWVQTLTDAVRYMMPQALRGLFSILLVDCQLTGAVALWEQFEQDLCEDFLHRRRQRFRNPALQLNAEDRHDGLRDLQRLLASRDNSLEQHGFPVPPLPPRHDLEPDFLQPHLLYDREALAREVAQQEPGLNDLQRVAYNSITHALANSLHTANDVTAFRAAHPDGPIPPNFFFVYSPGGCGKTHLNTLLLNRVRSQGHIALAMASSGIAALLMAGGSTFHSRCKPPRQPYVNDLPLPCAIPFGKPIGELFLRAYLLLIDEVSMLNRSNLECLDVALRDLMSNVHPALKHVPFGGKVVVCTGDYRQILPVVKNENHIATVHASLSSSYLWQHVRVLELVENMRIKAARLAGAPNHELEWFNDWLLALGEGRPQPPPPPPPIPPPQIPPPPPPPPEHVVIPPFMLAPDELGNDPKRLIDHIYGSFDVAANREDRRLIERAILAPRNKDVDALNAHAVASFPGEEFVYSSADRVADETQAHMFPPEYLHTINPPGFAPHDLRLKVGIPIILLRNISPALGLANGTRLVITHLSRSVIQAKILTGSHVGNIVCIPRIIMNTDADDKTIPIQIRRRQFPVRPAFAMTINKSQGQTFKEIAIYLPAPVFAHGQLYVALSRVGDPRKITILITHPPLPDQPPGLPMTLNVVYTEIFQQVNAPLLRQPQPQQQHHHQHHMEI